MKIRTSLTRRQLLVQFQSGVTLLYCFWATPPEQRTENYDSPDVSDALRACSNILAIMSERWPKADCLRDVFELLAREVSVYERPNRPPIRFSGRSVAAIREKLPEVKALVVHRSIMRMIEEMIAEDFPRPLKCGVDSDNPLSTMRTSTPTIQRNDNAHSMTARGYEDLSPTWTFEMPFASQPMYDFAGVDTEHDTMNSDAFLSFPGMFTWIEGADGGIS